MKDLHPKIVDALAYPKHGTVVDGILGSGAIDTSGEYVDLKGMDISSLLKDGVLNSEHISEKDKDKKFDERGKEQEGIWSTIIGRCIFAKKIFTKDDCESKRELEYWEEIQLPFLYGSFELYDNDGHENAKAAASIMRHYHDRGFPIVIRYSIEGNTIDRDGNKLTATIVKKVAATIKPCNHSAISGLVAMAGEGPSKPYKTMIEESSSYPPDSSSESSSEQSSYFSKTESTELGFTSSFEMKYTPIVNSVDRLKNAFKELTKALTLGSGNVAPGNATQGAALSVEDVARKKEILKSCAMAAYRDWPMTMPFKTFLKHRLPEADDKFIDKFTDMVDDYHLKKNNLMKNELPIGHLKDLEKPIPTGAKQFRGKWYIPGEAEIISGPFEGSKVRVLFVDDKSVYVEPFKAGDQDSVKINKMSRNFEGSHFKINKMPEPANVHTHVHGDTDVDPDLNETVEQRELVHGIDLASEPLSQLHPHGSTEARTKGKIGWFKSAHDKISYVKPSVNFPHDALQKDPASYIPTSKREVIYYNLAKNFFGLGEYVPCTATFNHPETGHDHSAMQQVPFAEHVQIKDRDCDANNRLTFVGDRGELDKLAVMDVVMGCQDRNRLNYLCSAEAPHVFLIDNSLLFDYKDSYLPAYLHDYHTLKGGPDINNDYMSPENVGWLLSLDPFKLNHELQRQGVNSTIAVQAVGRLMSMQSAALEKKSKKSDILFAHDRYLKAAQPQPPLEF